MKRVALLTSSILLTIIVITLGLSIMKEIEHAFTSNKTVNTYQSNNTTSQLNKNNNVSNVVNNIVNSTNNTTTNQSMSLELPDDIEKLSDEEKQQLIINMIRAKVTDDIVTNYYNKIYNNLIYNNIQENKIKVRIANTDLVLPFTGKQLTEVGLGDATINKELMLSNTNSYGFKRGALRVGYINDSSMDLDREALDIGTIECSDDTVVLELDDTIISKGIQYKNIIKALKSNDIKIESKEKTSKDWVIRLKTYEIAEKSNVLENKYTPESLKNNKNEIRVYQYSLFGDISGLTNFTIIYKKYNVDNISNMVYTFKK